MAAFLKGEPMRVKTHVKAGGHLSIPGTSEGG